MGQALIDAVATQAMDDTMRWAGEQRQSMAAGAGGALQATIAQALRQRPAPKSQTEVVIDECRRRAVAYADMLVRQMGLATVGEKAVVALNYEVKELQATYRLAASELLTFRSRRNKDLTYELVQCDKLDRAVEVGFEYQSAERGDSEQPGCDSCVEVSEVWAGGFNIAAGLTQDVIGQLARAAQDAHEGVGQ